MMTEMIDAAADTESPPLSTPLWRRLLFSPSLWGVGSLAAAVIVVLGTSDLELPQMFLMLVGGWLLGIAFVNLTHRMPRHGLALHILGAVAIAAVLVVLAEAGGQLLARSPDVVRAAVIVVQLAAVTGGAWTWIGLLARVTDALTRRERRRAPARVAPEWEREESGDGSAVRFPAVELRMREVVAAIVGIVLVVASVGLVLMIAFDDVVMHLGARLSIVLLGLVLGLPVYAAFTLWLRRRTESCTVAFGNDEIRVVVGERNAVIPFSALEHLRWRMRSDYARVEVRGAGTDLSLFAGLARVPADRTAELPAVPRRVFRRLELAGFTIERSRRDEVVTVRRR